MLLISTEMTKKPCHIFLIELFKVVEEYGESRLWRPIRNYQRLK
ncbi:UNVERIFIED_CONTAM: hypothetical protein GTU68_033032 [Idotea baltica]|nr:hypothetical protein [Idotea baltica]